MFRERDCIAIAFLGDTDFRSFADMSAVKQALLDSGQTSGSAGAIWRFTDRRKPGDIVVANKGIDTIPYIAPNDVGNPSPDPEYRHSRNVRWVITEPLNFAKRLFVQQTVGRVFSDDWQFIKAGYLKEYPHLADLFAEIEGKVGADNDGERSMNQFFTFRKRTRIVCAECEDQKYHSLWSTRHW